MLALALLLLLVLLCASSLPLVLLLLPFLDSSCFAVWGGCLLLGFASSLWLLLGQTPASQEEQEGGEKEWSGAPSAWQRSLHCILAQCPTTAGSAQFCLLCCQPEPVPRSLAARLPQFTLRDPCRLPAWLGSAINMLCRTCQAPAHSITQAPRATGGWILPAPGDTGLLAASWPTFPQARAHPPHPPTTPTPTHQARPPWAAVGLGPGSGCLWAPG